MNTTSTSTAERYDRALGGPKHAMRQGNWKLLADAKLEKFELYNLESDLAETIDLFAKERNRVKRIIAEIKELHKQIQNDPFSV